MDDFIEQRINDILIGYYNVSIVKSCGEKPHERKGIRKEGRPKICWIHDVEGDLKSMEIMNWRGIVEGNRN